MKIEDTQKFTKDLTNEELAALGDSVQAEIKSRRPQVTRELLDQITPNMSKEDSARIRGVLEQAAKDYL